MMNELSVLIGGKAGFGIDRASLLIANLLSRLSYRLYIYRDYPSLIRGGHTFSIIRASGAKVASHANRVDCLLALNQETADRHKERLKEDSIVIYDSDAVKADGMGIPFGRILKEENAPEIMRNTIMIGAFCKAVGIEWSIVEAVFKKNMRKDAELNLKVASRGYSEAKELRRIVSLNQKRLPLFTGNELMGLGLIKGGLKTYIAYPMTPTSPVLHFLASEAQRFSLKVIHPESEIAVMLMALGSAYCGEKVAVGTSGGGFCLMTEGLSLSAMAELPVVILLGQRPGPSTGLPTHTSQTELFFALYAGQGEFPRLVAAPGDAEEAYYWPQVALNISTKYQVPSIILSDKTMGEGTYSFDIDSVREVLEEKSPLWDRKGPYKRYLDTENGVSPLTFVPDKDAIIKTNSYEHDEYGITTEDPKIATAMQEKRLRKKKHIAAEMENYEAVKVHGDKHSSVAVLCWGSNKGVTIEAAKKFGLKVIQPVLLSPFPLRQFQGALKNVRRLISVENNATAQLVGLINRYGLNASEKILKYDGRPFSVDELEARFKEVLS